ncbi:HAD-IA family hydrolase [Parafrigoribacterium soli]|uniref:HAD-IA family hydrolase n=1 Tax=Parafrigoribacterium soli TaxID=3144663 RepID=UPI0032ED764F
MDLYLFDFDKTLYAYDFRRRLPALARITGASEYHLAKSWWAGGYEARAEAGAWRNAHEYLEKFAEVTGYPLSLEQWCESRHEASTPITGSVAALRRSSALGTVSLFSNNPSPFAETLDHTAPDVAEILGENVLVSFQLGARKPDDEANLRALRHYDARPEDTLFIDDSRANVASAASLGMHVHHFLTIDGVPQVDALNDAIDRFAGRNG